MKKLFSSDWTISHIEDSENAVPVCIPHDAMLREKRTETSLGGTHTGWFEGWDYRYKKIFLYQKNGRNIKIDFILKACIIWRKFGLMERRRPFIQMDTLDFM